MSDAERVIAEAETYAAESALDAEHGELVDHLEHNLRLSACALADQAHAAQDAMAGLYRIAKAHAELQEYAARQLALAMPARFADSGAFELHGVTWSPPDPKGILQRTVAFVLIDANGAPPPPPSPVPPVIFDDGRREP